MWPLASGSEKRTVINIWTKSRRELASLENFSARNSGSTLKSLQLSQLMDQKPCSTLIHEIFIHHRVISKMQI